MSVWEETGVNGTLFIAARSTRQDVHSEALAQSISWRRDRDIVAVREKESFMHALILRICARKKVELIS